MRRGFTLIEIMICLAIIAIISGTATVAWLGLGQLRREGDFRFALQSARHQLAELQEIAFDALPPQVLTVGRTGEIHLGQGDIVPGTVRLSRLDGAGASLAPDGVEGRTVRVSPRFAGARLMVDYEFFLPSRNEAQLVETGGKVRLWNTPAVRVESVRVARGAALTPVTGWRLSPDRSSLDVPGALTGRAVVVDYLGQRLRNRVRGRFLDEALRDLDRPSPLKLLEVSEDYGEKVGTLRLSTLRVNR